MASVGRASSFLDGILLPGSRPLVGRTAGVLLHQKIGAEVGHVLAESAVKASEEVLAAAAGGPLRDEIVLHSVVNGALQWHSQRVMLQRPEQ